MVILWLCKNILLVRGNIHLKKTCKIWISIWTKSIKVSFILFYFIFCWYTKGKDVRTGNPESMLTLVVPSPCLCPELPALEHKSFVPWVLHMYKGKQIFFKQPVLFNLSHRDTLKIKLDDKLDKTNSRLVKDVLGPCMERGVLNALCWWLQKREIHPHVWQKTISHWYCVYPQQSSFLSTFSSTLSHQTCTMALHST